MRSLFFLFVVYMPIFSALAEEACPNPKYFDPWSGDKIEVSKDELKEGKKSVETIDYVSLVFNSKEIRLYSNGDIKDSKAKKYSNIKGNYSFNWVKAYEYKKMLILQPGYNDGVDINASTLYLLDSKKLKPLTTFSLPCMHNDEKILDFEGRLTYVCRYQVETKEGLVHSYFPDEKRWNELKKTTDWGAYKKLKALPEIKVKIKMKFWKKIELSKFDKKC